MSESTQNSESAASPVEQGKAGQLFYPLNSGAIDTWLVAGPHATPLDQPASSTGIELGRNPNVATERVSSLLRAARTEHSFLPYPHFDAARISPADDPPLFGDWRADPAGAPAEKDSFPLGESMLTWQAYRCLDDHYIDLGAFYPTWHYVQAWACAELVCPTAQQVEFVVNVRGAAQIWLNGEQLLQQELRRHNHLITVEAPLQAGHNQILARLDTAARGDSPQRFGLSIPNAAQAGWSVCLPTRIAALDRRHQFERFFEECLARPLPLYPRGKR